ncbi:unnamed protein product, partial [marine sediment metagenome]
MKITLPTGETVNPENIATRLKYCGNAVTIDGHLARVINFRGPDALIRSIDGKVPDVLFSWGTALAVCVTSGRF